MTNLALLAAGVSHTEKLSPYWLFSETDSRIRADICAYSFPTSSKQCRSCAAWCRTLRKARGQFNIEQVLANSAEGWPTVDAMQIWFRQSTNMNLVQLFHNNTSKQNPKQTQTEGLIFMSHYILGTYYKWRKKKRKKKPSQEALEEKDTDFEDKVVFFFSCSSEQA